MLIPSHLELDGASLKEGKAGNKSTPRSYILRITRDEWVRQVFSIKKYYPGIRRKWKLGAPILFVHRVEDGDSFIGYGVLGRIQKREELSNREKEECERMGWWGALNFEKVVRFEPPLLIKDTWLGAERARGKCLHGFPLLPSQVESILNKAKQLCNLQEVG